MACDLLVGIKMHLNYTKAEYAAYKGMLIGRQNVADQEGCPLALRRDVCPHRAFCLRCRTLLIGQFALPGLGCSSTKSELIVCSCAVRVVTLHAAIAEVNCADDFVP